MEGVEKSTLFFFCVIVSYQDMILAFSFVSYLDMIISLFSVLDFSYLDMNFLVCKLLDFSYLDINFILYLDMKSAVIFHILI